MPTLIGYARVSTSDQNLDLQLDALKKAGCIKIFKDVASGSKSNRPGLEAALTYMRKEDTLVVWRLDRLGRSLRHLINVVTQIHDKEMSFKSLTENLDTSTSSGQLLFHIFGSLAEFESSLIRERTRAGLSAARARGRQGGRPRVMDSRKVALAKSMLSDPANGVAEVSKTLGVSKATLYTYLNREDGLASIDPDRDK